MLLQERETTTTEVKVDKEGGFYLTSETIKEGDNFLVTPSDDYRFLNITPSGESDETISSENDGEIYIPFSINQNTNPDFYWVKEKDGCFQLTPNNIGIAKGYFATTDVYNWVGDLDEDGEDKLYNSLDSEEYTEDGLDYSPPCDGVGSYGSFLGNPYETQTLEEWILSNYGYTETPLLIQVWYRRYATLESEDEWQTYFSTDYGEAPWGSDDYVVYKNQILTNEEREKLSNLLIQPEEG